MAMIPLKCPSCSADITLDDSKEFGFCQYCGTRIQNDAIKKLKVEYSGDPMSVMSVYDNGTTVNTTNTTINNITNTDSQSVYNIDNHKPKMIVSRPKIRLIIIGVILLIFCIMGFSVTIEQRNLSGLIIDIPLLVGGIVCIKLYIKQSRLYDMAVKNAIRRNEVTNREE